MHSKDIAGHNSVNSEWERVNGEEEGTKYSSQSDAIGYLALGGSYSH